MIILMNGEGKTDLGTKEWDKRGQSWNIRLGPMGALVDCLVGKNTTSPHNHRKYDFVDKDELARKKEQLKNDKRQTVLRGVGQSYEEAFFKRQAQVFGEIAKERQSQEPARHVIAVMFRDADTSSSAAPNSWEKKFLSIVNGFKAIHFDKGVPMVPNPTSEAWLLALFEKPSVNCKKLENRHDRDQMKKDVAEKLQQRDACRDMLAKWIGDGDNAKVTLSNLESMPSFLRFKEYLLRALPWADFKEKQTEE